jgi:ketosteroid isomerase-like protein
MTTGDAARVWVEGYLRAWSSNEADDVRALFTEDAVYSTGPHDPDALRGREAIVAGWLGHRDEPGTWGFAYDVLGEVDDRTVVRGVTTYTDGSDYDNIWFVTLVDGRASAFTEWFVERA